MIMMILLTIIINTYITYSCKGYHPGIRNWPSVLRAHRQRHPQGGMATGMEWNGIIMIILLTIIIND